MSFQFLLQITASTQYLVLVKKYGKFGLKVKETSLIGYGFKSLGYCFKSKGNWFESQKNQTKSKGNQFKND